MKKKLIIIIIVGTIITAALCYTLNYYDILHISPYFNVGALSNLFPQQHVCFDGRDHYYYDQTLNGVCREASDGTCTLIYHCKNISGITCYNGMVYFCCDNKLFCVASDGAPISERTMSESFGSTAYLTVFQDQLLVLPSSAPYYDAPFLARCFSLGTLEEQEKVSFSYNDFGKWKMNFTSGDNVTVFLTPPSQNNGTVQAVELRIEDAVGADYKYSLRTETANRLYFVLFLDDGLPLNKERALSGHAGDVMFCYDSGEARQLRKIAETGKNERILYADETTYCIYKRADRAYHFYDTETGSETHMIKENTIRSFHKYTFEPSGEKIFVYEGDRLVDKIATVNKRG